MRIQVAAAVLLLGCAAPPEPPRNLLLVTVDTLRADRIGAYGYTAAATPRIDALAERSIRFERAYAHSSMTLPSVASLITGLLPAQHGIFANRGRLKQQHATLAARLKAAGFATGAFIGNYALRPTRMLWPGFDRYTDSFHERELVRGHPENDAASLTGEAIAWLDERREGEPFLLWIHYQEPHGPYTPKSFPTPETGGPTLPKSDSQSGRHAIPDYQWLGHGRLAEYQARYDGEVAEVDRQLGRLLDAFEARGLLERSAVLFTADHGEAFGEDDLYCAHGEGLSEALLHVPLLLSAPGLAPRARTDRVRLIDVAPTLLALFGVPAGELPGRSLLEDAGDRPLVSQLVLRQGRWRSIRREDATLTDDAASEPRVQGAADPAQRAALLAELERLAPWPLRLADLHPLSREEEENLRAMGYAN